jgi:hypothetical protein
MEYTEFTQQFVSFILPCIKSHHILLISFEGETSEGKTELPIMRSFYADLFKMCEQQKTRPVTGS